MGNGGGISKEPPLCIQSVVLGLGGGGKGLCEDRGDPSAREARLPRPPPVTESVLLVKGPASLKRTN